MCFRRIWQTLCTASRKSFSVATFLRALNKQRYYLMRHTQDNHLVQTAIAPDAIYLRILFVNISAHLMANMPASVQTLRNSAPVELGHSRASSSYLEKPSSLFYIWVHAGISKQMCSPNVLLHTHWSCMNFENVCSSVKIWQRELHLICKMKVLNQQSEKLKNTHLPIQPSWPHQGRVKCVWSVCCHQHLHWNWQHWLFG